MAWKMKLPSGKYSVRWRDLAGQQRTIQKPAPTPSDASHERMGRTAHRRPASSTGAQGHGSVRPTLRKVAPEKRCA